jgi:outer membrane protein assembly factor BamB
MRWKVKTNTGFSSFSVGDGKAYTLVSRQVGADLEQQIDTLLELPQGWLHRQDPDKVGEKEKWFMPGKKDKPWRPLSTRKFWPDYVGDGWYAVDVEIPSGGDKNVWLVFGAIDENYTLWINGEYIGDNREMPPQKIWNQPVSEEITGKYKPGEINHIVVRVNNTARAGGIWKPIYAVTGSVGKFPEESYEVCVALDIDRGAEIWAAPCGPARYDGGGDHGASDNEGGDGPRSTPTFNDGKVYVLDAYLTLYCFDANNGDVVWKRDVLNSYAGRLVAWQSTASPLVEGDHVFVMGGGEGQALLAFDKHTGDLAWRVEDDGMSHATPVAATIHGVRQIIFFTQTGLVAVAPKTGFVLWRQHFPFSTSAAASPVVYEDIVYCSAGYRVGAGAYRISKEEHGFHAEEIWRKPKELMNHWSTPVCKNGYVFGMYGHKQYGDAPLQCVDMRTGETLWSQRGFGQGNCILVGDYVIALSDAGHVVVLDATHEQYNEVFRSDVLSGKCWSSPAFSDGKLYVRSTEEGACVAMSAVD